MRVQARAGRNQIAGERDGAVLVRVAAAPVDGKANEAVRKLIAKRARVGRTRVEIVHGQGSRDKVVRVEGVTEAALRDALGL